MDPSRQEQMIQELEVLLERATEEDNVDFLKVALRKYRLIHDLKLKFPSVLVDKTTAPPQIYYEGSPILSEDGTNSPYLHELKDRVKTAELIQEDGMMDGHKLFELVYQASHGTCQKFRPQRVALSTNLIQESIEDCKDCGVVFLQQIVFPPIVELFSCFDLYSYCADLSVWCPHVIRCKTEQGEEEWNKVRCSPDAAIRLADMFYVMAMMEVKDEVDLNTNDLYRCQLMTTLSLLAMLDNFKTQMKRARYDAMLYRPNNAQPAATEPPKLPYETLVMPFVLCHHDTARLYVTRLEVVDETVHISYTRLMTCPFCSSSRDELPDQALEDVKKKVGFMSILAILVADIYAIGGRISKDIEMELDGKDPFGCKELPNAIEGTTSPRTIRDSHSSDASDQTQESVSNWVKPSAREDEAKRVASRNGKVQRLGYPWGRVQDYNLDANKREQWQEEMDFYMQESPFYFRGVYGSTDVFCKVWREGDSRTCREDIAEEIEFHHQANISGVPSTKVIDELTAMDVDAPLKSDDDNISTGCQYHVLVSEYYQNDPVAEEDILEFALSLVGTVLALHGIGILHCDIKRSNILWDAKAKLVRLVDFGLAQKEENARSYRATRKYEAPEIRGENQPHSRLSDAYSVGKTMEEIIGKNFDTPEAKEILNVSKMLQCPVVSDRLSLERAATMLVSRKGSASITGMKRSHDDLQNDTTFENV